MGSRVLAIITAMCGMAHTYVMLFLAPALLFGRRLLKSGALTLVRPSRGSTSIQNTLPLRTNGGLTTRADRRLLRTSTCTVDPGSTPPGTRARAIDRASARRWPTPAAA